MTPLACTTCRLIRRFLMAFALGGFVAWQVTGELPFHADQAILLKGMLLVVIAFSMVNLMIRLRQMRARWRR